MIQIKFQVFLQSTTHPLKIDVGLHFGGFGPDCIFIGRAIDAALVSFDIALVSLGFALVGFGSERVQRRVCTQSSVRAYAMVGTRVPSGRYALAESFLRA